MRARAPRRNARPYPSVKRFGATAAQKPRLLGVFCVTRHESVKPQAKLGVARRFGIVPLKGVGAPPEHMLEHSYGLDLPGEARAVKFGERLADQVMALPGIRAQLKQRGVIYSGVYSPLVRAIETGNQNQQGLAMRLRDMKIKLAAHFSHTDPHLAIVRIGKSLKYYPAPKSADEQRAVTEIERWSKGESVPGWESKTDAMRRALVAKHFKEDLLKKAARGELKGNKPIVFMNFVGHGGVGNIPGDIDFLASSLTGMKNEDLKGVLKRGEGLAHLVFSDGTTKTIVLKK